MTPATDQVLGQRYKLVSRIAGGGMGEVWEAADEVLGRTVAVKILRREFADDPTFLERFRAEARHTAGLSHAGIAAVYDYSDGGGSDDGTPRSPFLVMEKVPGEPLSALIAREGALPPERVLDIVGQAAHALQAAHDAEVIHRDVKPGNILLTPDGQVKITDFGIARAANSLPLTATGAIMGTAYYISPEQASGRPVTPASDVYSLGVVAYECLTGRRPFAGDTPVSVALAQVRDQPPALGPEIDPQVSALVMHMLAKDPADRPGSAGELGREALALRPAVAHLAATRVLVADGSAATRALTHGPDGDDGPDTGGLAGLPTGAGRGPGTDTDPGFRLPAPGRTQHWVPYAVVLALTALVVVLVVHACADEATTSDASATSPTAGATGAPPEAVQVRAGDYLGKPVAQARAALRALGLRVAVRPAPAEKGAKVGTVTGVHPTGRLSPDETVTLDYAQAGKPGHSKPGKGKHKGEQKGNE